MNEKNQSLIKSKKLKEALDAAHAIINDPDITAPELETAPGNAALKIYPDILNEIAQNVRSIIVTGTNGKTTVVRMIASILDEAGIEYISNLEGANMENRITGLYCGNLDPSSGPVKKTAIIECDEGYLRLVMPKINPLCLVITCIYPDQLERFKSEANVAELICDAMQKTVPSTCIVSGDCHFLKDKICKVPGWSFVEYEAQDDTEKTYKLNIPGAFNQENAAAAATVGHMLGISEEVILRGLEKTQPAFGRFETFDYGKGHIIICLAKNAAGFEAISRWISESDSEKKRQIIIAMNDNDGDDKNPAWLKNNDYKKIMNLSRRNFVTGTCAGIVIDMMKGNGITEDEESEMNVTECAMESIPDICADFAGETIVIANYTAMMQIREIFVKLGKIRPYWETRK